ncbi:helix-turn-helix transcriptional regulator [Bradyrhizobium sp.]|uniref:helix-turn-helix transcriptional regulator n=1 Tax=Bradyrhizobium sp. TaxID=376 RepID=UPI003C78D86B
MIPDSEVLSDLIGTVYDTTLDRSLWPEALRKSVEFVGGSAVALYSKNAARKTGKTTLYWNSRSDTPAIHYFDEYVRIDPATTCQFMFDVGQAYSIGDCIPYKEFFESRVYKEWAKPQRWLDHLGVNLDKSATSFSVFGIFRDDAQGLVDEEMRRRMRLIIPHVRRAVLIGNVLDLNATEARGFADTLNGLAAGVFLVDRNACLIFANTSGQIMLDDRKAVCRENRTLIAVDPRAATALRDVIALARHGDAAVGTRGVAIPLSFPPADIWLAHVLPLTSGARQQAGTACSAVAAVFVHKASLETPLAMETMSKLYRLTPAELRVLAAMIEVGSISAVAVVVGISEATVKTHLQHLFAKTGTSRQAELIKLVAANASPLREIS